jgi:hypothetical protein
MTAPALTRTDFTVLDQRITRSLMALRSARAASMRVRNRMTTEALEKAEANLDALLDYRYAAQQRSTTTTTGADD